MEKLSINRKMYLLNFKCDIKEVEKRLPALNSLEQKVMSCYLGINQEKDISLEEIAIYLNLPKEKIVGIFSSANIKLNKIIPKLNNEDKALYEIDEFIELAHENKIVDKQDLKKLELSLLDYLNVKDTKKLMDEVINKLKDTNIEINQDEYRKEKEYKLIELYQSTKNEEYLNELINMHKKILLAKAYRYSRFKTNFTHEDFYQEIVAGFIEAVQNFDLKKDLRLLTYAEYLFIKNIYYNIYLRSYQFSLSDLFYNNLAKYNKLVDKFQNTFNRNPTIEEICTNLDINEKNAKELIDFDFNKKAIFSLDYENGDDEGNTLKNIIPDNKVNVESELPNKCLSDVLKQILTEKEMQIISLRWGLADGRTRTLKEVGNIFNVTRQCIDEIEINAFQKIRKSKIFSAYLNEEKIRERYYSITKYFDVDLDYIKLCLKYVSKEVQRNVYDTWGPNLQRKIKYSKFIPGISTFINCLNTYKNLYNETNSLIAVENAIKNPHLFHLYETGALENIHTLYSSYSKREIYECIKSIPSITSYLKINHDKTLNIKAIFESNNFWHNYLKIETILANKHKLVLK